MRKLIRKHLPHPDALREQRMFRMFGNTLLHPRLWHLNRHSAAGGLAVGVFCSLVPGPFQILSAALLCMCLRVNLPVAILGTLLSNPLTIVPLYAAAVSIGSLVSGERGHFAAPPDFAWAAPQEMLANWCNWLLTLGKPLLIGLPILGLILAAISYLGVRLAWEAWLRRAWGSRRAARAAREQTQH